MYIQCVNCQASCSRRVGPVTRRDKCMVCTRVSFMPPLIFVGQRTHTCPRCAVCSSCLPCVSGISCVSCALHLSGRRLEEKVGRQVRATYAAPHGKGVADTDSPRQGRQPQHEEGQGKQVVSYHARMRRSLFVCGCWWLYG